MKKLFGSLALAAGLACSAVPASAAIVATLSSSATHYNVGDLVVVTLGISGLGDEILSAYDLNLLFDGTLLTSPIVATSLTQFGGVSNISNSINFAPGDLDTTLFSLLSDDDLAALQANDFTWLTYSFQAAADGATTLQFGADPDFERNFVGRDALSLQVALNTLCISVGTGTCVQSVPEPASMALVGVALSGLMVPGAVRRRRAAAAEA